MTLRQALEALGYTADNENWVSDGAQADVARRAASDAEAAHGADSGEVGGYIGTYTFRTRSGVAERDPYVASQAAVHVIEASCAEAARDIHRRLWCTGSAPFLMVMLPGEVRVYSGFKFDVRAQTDEALERVPLTSQAIREALADFHARQIDEGRIWHTRGQQVFVQSRIDYRLLDNLTNLSSYLRDNTGLPLATAQALIGKYIYFHYLHARSIVTDTWLEKNDIRSDEVFGRSPTLRAFQRLTLVLQERFNGQIFPLPLEGQGAPTDDDIRYVASTLNGDDRYTGQLALDFGAYDFSYIPIELLSSIYEKFMNESGHGRREGAVYTPEPLAEYLISELNAVRPLAPGMKILDPCCGSGVFLVLAYRRLITLHRRLAERPLTPNELKDILTRSIYGVERNREACYVAEFSLLLTMLSEIDPPELERNEGFRFPELHGINIFAQDFFDEQGPFAGHCGTFDWVMGNPPWVELDPRDERNAPAISWMNQASKSGMPTSRYRACEAFCWRAAQMIRHGGHVGLLIHATSLVNASGAEFRAAFFTAHTVFRLTNFANLAYILFANAQVPAATLVFRPAEPEEAKPPILHYGPFVANQLPVSATMPKRLAWVITIYDNEIQNVDASEAEKGDAATWKFALWGNHLDRGAVKRLRRLFGVSLGVLCERKGWSLCLGVQLRPDDSAEAIKHVSSLKGMNKLDTKQFERGKVMFRLVVPEEGLVPVPSNMCNIRVRGGEGGLRILSAPHIFLNQNVAAFSNRDFVIMHPQVGLSAGVQDEDHLRAIALILNSSVFRYLMFFVSPTWGISISRLELEPARRIPVPELTPDQILSLANLHRDLSDAESQRNGIFSENVAVASMDAESFFVRQQERIDAAVRDALRVPLSLSELAGEFVNIRYLFVKGKQDAEAMGRPDERLLSDYAARLRDTLDDYVGERHLVTVFGGSPLSDGIGVSIEITDTPTSEIPPVPPQLSGDGLAYAALWEDLRTRQNQWFYVQRNLKVFAWDKIYLVKPARRLDWTQTQARLDADDLIADIVSFNRRGTVPSDPTLAPVATVR